MKRIIKAGYNPYDTQELISVIEQAEDMVLDARDDGSAEIAWQLVDFLYDTDLLKFSRQAISSIG